MPEICHCPHCGRKLSASSLGRLCPRCMLQKALATTPAVPDREATPIESIRSFGDYELMGEIARGGMGVVYRARQISLNRTVAVKMILSGHFASRETVRRFLLEATATAQLQHPNIVAIHEVGEHEGQQFFSMEYINGRSLAELARDRPLPPAQAARYVQTVAEAIQYAHDRATLHRDLKPSNVLIDPYDEPRITDFGLALRLDEPAGATTSGRIMGSPGYMPPEQVAGRRDAIGPHSDVYGLGALLYHAVTGRAPFAADSIEATLAQVVADDPPRPRTLNPNVPGDLETICLKCLEKEPARRYRTAREVAEELDRFLSERPIQARPIGWIGRAARWRRRNPTVALLVGLAVVLFASGLTGIIWQWRRAEAYARREASRRQQAERALTELETRVLQGSATNGTAFARVARRLLRLEGYDESYRLNRAELWSTRAIEASPDTAEVWLVHAEVLLNQARVTAAIVAVSRAAALHPADPDSWFRVGELLCQHRVWPEGLSALTNAISLAPFKNKTSHRRAITEAKRALYLSKPAQAATDNWLEMLNISPRNPLTPASCLDLSRHFNASLAMPWHNRAIPQNHLGVLLAGDSRRPAPLTSAGTTFDLRGVVQLASRSSESLEPGFPATVGEITVGRRCQRLHFLHAAAFVYQPVGRHYDGAGEKIASYVIHYDDGSTDEIPLRSGINIDEWHVGKWSPGPTEAKIAWEGKINSGAITRLYHLTWENRRPSTAIAHLDFVSTMAAGAAFVVAISTDP